ncbi:phosphoinositide-binding protein [Strigomonas culicis]|uniref:Phosphoinositide-binding protein n=1 Tax=Strigomonas culicis TaxID=28005 RepID=S9VAW7_9TRYP|nr:phosphoinositide-binding protein [Strigomonas culicis]|eukprot:EPY24151.1 phosphoinositide-binding protein [Strigomonas culicis]
MSNGLLFEIGDAIEAQGQSTFSLSHYEYPVTMRSLAGKELRVVFMRRYNDFLTLRNMLSAKYWFCVVPPIPEKETAIDAVDKLKSAAVLMVRRGDEAAEQKRKTEEFLQYRRELLRIFLQKLCHHPLLCDDDLLKRFFVNDDEWERKAKEPIKMPPFLSVSILSSWKGMAKRSEGEPAGITYTKAVARLEQAADRGAGDRGAPLLSLTEIEGIARHVNCLATNFAALRAKTDALAHQHREVADALQQFATSFAAIVEDEEDAALKKAVNPVALHCGSMSTLYEKQYRSELKNVVFKLGYHSLSSLAVGETVERLYVAVQYIQQLSQTQSELDKKISRATAPNKCMELRTQRTQIGTQRLEVENELNAGMEKFKVDFLCYHNFKQEDMLEFLEVFKRIQMKSAEQLKKEWDDVLSSTEELME